MSKPFAFIQPICTEPVGNGWTLVFSVADVGPPKSYVVEMALNDVVKGRSSTSRQYTEEAQAIAFLRARALLWIQEYSGREHSGDSDFGKLE